MSGQAKIIKAAGGCERPPSHRNAVSESADPTAGGFEQLLAGPLRAFNLWRRRRAVRSAIQRARRYELSGDFADPAIVERWIFGDNLAF